VKLPDVDVVWDLEKIPWPFKTDSVDEVFCSHYIEHTDDFIKFMNEVYRILKVGAKCTVIAPYYSSMRAWMDPTHKRAISEQSFLYVNKGWRDANQLDHCLGATCDFDFTYGYIVTPEWATRNEEARAFAIKYYINVVSDIQVILTKRG
jgi:ubiquinone/menaquinone biosynthesis C-methylase UbiE